MKMSISTKYPVPVQLSFAVLYPIHEAIAEIQVNKDVELCMKCVDALHEALKKTFSGHVGVLVNRVHPYSYDSNAQFKITTAPQIKAIGIVHHNSTSWVASQTVQDLPPNRLRNMRNFWQRDAAIAWLLNEMGFAA